MFTFRYVPSVPRKKNFSCSFMCVIIAVLIVTVRFPGYTRNMVNVSSTSLSTPRFEAKCAITDEGRPNSARAWSMECDPSPKAMPSPGEYEGSVQE